MKQVIPMRRCNAHHRHRGGIPGTGPMERSAGTGMSRAGAIPGFEIVLYTGSCIQSLLAAICAFRVKGVVCDGLD